MNEEVQYNQKFSAENKGRGKVIAMPVRETNRSLGNAKSTSTALITQERLRRGAELLAQEYAVIRAMREFTLTLEYDLAAGATIEPGELTFDQMLKIVRSKREPASAPVDISKGA